MVQVRKAVVLARGLGTRMQRPDPNASLQPGQADAAAAGAKAMMPFGRPFLDYVLSGLADAGYTDVCLVIGPEHDAVREYYTRKRPPRRTRVTFAVQQRALGTADAVRAAEAFTAGELFLTINADNLYPIEACRALRAMGQPGLAAFSRDALVGAGAIDGDRIRAFAIVTFGADCELQDIVEKPDERTVAGVGGDMYVSMNCWLFDRSIFSACAAVPVSARGELELPEAVRFAIRTLGHRFRVLAFDLPVLDLSTRSDVAIVAERLAGIEPEP